MRFPIVDKGWGMAGAGKTATAVRLQTQCDTSDESSLQLSVKAAIEAGQDFRRSRGNFNQGADCTDE